MPHKTNIVVSLVVPGTHRWENCPIPEVSFLRDYHRHLFHIRVEKAVSHSDRDVEIILFKQQILDHMYKTYQNNDVFYKPHGDNCLFFDYRSCEHIANELLEEFDLESCQVLEDGENGAIVYKQSQS